MASRQKRIPHRKLSHKSIPDGTFYVDYNGIHVDNQSRGTIEIYSHSGDTRCIASYPRIGVDGKLTRLLGATSDIRVAYASDRMVFAGDGSRTFDIKHDSMLNSVCAFVWHPYRSTYLALLRDGQIEELTGDFSETRHIFHDFCESIDIVGSNYSTNIYTTWRDWDTIGLRAIYSDKSIYYVIDDSPDADPIILMRPEHPEVLTVLYDSTLAIIDLWQSGSRSQPQRHDVHTASSGVHINSNICVTCSERRLCIFDYRYGLQTRIMPESMSNVWYAANLLYLRSEVGNMYVLDV